MLITLSITNASNVMQYFSRFTDDIFVALVSLIFVIEAGRSIGGDLFDGKLTQSEAWIGAEDNLTVIGPRSTIVTTANTPNGFRNTGDTPMRSYGVHASPTRTHFGTNTHLRREWRRATSQRRNWF